VKNKIQAISSPKAWAGAIICMHLSAACLGAGEFIARDGKPGADIVIAAQPTRSARLAALELQANIQKISGAKLEIVTSPLANAAAHIYVGRSAFTDRLKMTDADLKDGAFRISSGKDYLVLFGNDADFQPPAAWKLSREEQIKQWDALTGEKFGHPNLGPGRSYNPALGIWEADERGSLNAVYEFLRGLGARWYYPGEIGECLPTMKNIELPQAEKIIRPDFACRHMYFYYNTYAAASADEMKWQLQLGLNLYDMGGGHGIVSVHSRDEVKQAHPEYFALWGGKRAVGGGECLSSEGLFKQNLKYARAVFDNYPQCKLLSVMPADGYIALCQCDLCRGKDTPARGWEGQLSDYVWDYVNRVAIELYKTHPDRKITCCAYGAYFLPPEKIEKLSPNVVIVECRWRSDFQTPEKRDWFAKARAQWMEKLPSKEMYVWDYYLHTRPGGPLAGVPAYFPRAIADDLKSLKGVSKGDFIEVHRSWAADGHKWDALAASHLNCYTTARYYWDASQDINAMLDEYYEKFYGPAAKEMKAFVGYCEANWAKASKEVAVIDRIFELLGAAREKAGGGIYGRRVGLLVEYVQRLKETREKLSQGRKGAPRAEAAERDLAGFKPDGKLDEAFWKDVPVYELKSLSTNLPPIHKTTFQAAWGGNTLVFGIRCSEDDMKNLNIASAKDEDSNIWNGDCIEILLETPVHSYYQVAANPAGAVTDLDRKSGFNTRWSSGARAAAQREEGAWTLEVSLPAAGENAESIDPLNGIAGAKPTPESPWFFNLCRQRIREKERELSAFSPTGTKGFHDLLKFGELIVK